MTTRVLGLLGMLAVLLGAATPAMPATRLPDTAVQLSTAGSPVVAVAAARPNVLNIVLDDMRDDTLARMAAYMPRTVEWFAPGRFFANADVSTPSCCPSRATGMSGQYDHNNGMMHQLDIANFNLNSTVQHYLKGAGYRTCQVGKYLHGWDHSLPPQDFDRYSMWRSAAYWAFNANVQGTVTKINTYATTYAGARALDCLRRFAADPSRPWYTYVAFHAPHVAEDGLAHPLPRYAGAPVRACVQPGESDLTDKPAYLRWVNADPVKTKAICDSQMRALMSVDDEVGRLMTQLSESGQLANTMILLWSDNGYLWGEHNRTLKFVPYTSSLNIPLFIRWDGQVTAGVDTRLASNVDLAPTIYEATGVSPAVTMDGRSLLGGARRAYHLNEYWYDTVNSRVPTWAQVRDLRFAYIETYDAAGARAFREYYDLTADPGQLTNLLADGNASNDPSAARLGQLAAQLAAARSCVGANCP